jgi:hypothetical protein
MIDAITATERALALAFNAHDAGADAVAMEALTLAVEASKASGSVTMMSKVADVCRWFAAGKAQA